MGKNFLPLSSRKDPPSYSFRSASPRRRGGARGFSRSLMLRALFTGKLSPTTRSLKASRGSARGVNTPILCSSNRHRGKMTNQLRKVQNNVSVARKISFNESLVQKKRAKSLRFDQKLRKTQCELVSFASMPA